MYCETNPQMADPPTRAPPTASTTIRHSSSQLPYVRKKIDCSRQGQGQHRTRSLHGDEAAKGKERTIRRTKYIWQSRGIKTGLKGERRRQAVRLRSSR